MHNNEGREHTNWEELDKLMQPSHSELPYGDSGMGFSTPVQQGSLELTVIRANGTIEEHGVVSYYNKNPLKQAWWEAEKFGEVKPETIERLAEAAKKATPYVLGGAAAVGTVGMILRKYI